MDRLELKGLTFVGRHGVLAWEREAGQPFLVDLAVYLDLEEAGRSDDLTRTVDYGQLYRAVRTVVEGPPLQLLEAVAERIAQSILKAHPQVEGVEVTVKKPHAPVGGALRYAAARVRRWRRGPGR